MSKKKTPTKIVHPQSMEDVVRSKYAIELRTLKDRRQDMDLYKNEVRDQINNVMAMMDLEDLDLLLVVAERI